MGDQVPCAEERCLRAVEGGDPNLPGGRLPRWPAVNDFGDATGAEQIHPGHAGSAMMKMRRPCGHATAAPARPQWPTPSRSGQAAAAAVVHLHATTGVSSGHPCRRCPPPAAGPSRRRRRRSGLGVESSRFLGEAARSLNTTCPRRAGCLRDGRHQRHAQLGGCPGAGLGSSAGGLRSRGDSPASGCQDTLSTP